MKTRKTKVSLGTERTKMSVMDDMKAEFAAWEREDSLFQNGNKAAGTRARKALQEIKKLSQLRRKQIQDIKNAE